MEEEIFSGLADMIDFADAPKEIGNIIKVIGVGGGGGNAVNHMYTNGIHDVTFLQCNTDGQALAASPVPVRVQLGHEGLGAGDKPERGKQAALESANEIKRMLSDGTKMAFITAGMGGGTGTGAAPVIAQISKELGILTVGIVTIPFDFEGNLKKDQALDGVEELSKNVDALLVINNERLRKLYSTDVVLDAFAKADETLNIAAKSIAELITNHRRINLDFNDVKTVMKDGGVAIMSTGYGEGEGRVSEAIEDALRSPLLNNNDIFKSRKILLSIDFNDEKEYGGGLTMDEMGEIDNFMARFTEQFEIKWGLGVDKELGPKVKVTILATGFGLEDVDNMKEHVGTKQTKEDIATKQAKEEVEIQKQIRRDRYYGTSEGANIKRTLNIFLFYPDDLDNDDVIYAVEATPTARRTLNAAKQLRDLADGKVKNSTQTKEDSQTVISFS